MKKLLLLLFIVLLTGCASVVPEKDYTGMTKKQIFDELSKKGAVYIGYNVSRDKMFSNGGRRFESWQKLENDKLYFNMRQWRINTQDKRIFGKHYIKETVLTFHFGKVVKQELDEWTYPPSDEYCAKVEQFTSPQGKVLRPLLESEPMPRILPEVDIDRLKKDSGKGDEKAIIKLAICYAFGHQVPENFEEAERLLKSIAGKGNVDAQYLLGSLYANGPSEKRNYKAAAEWLTRAAEKGFVKAQCDLAALYLFGRGVPADSKKAFQLYQKAAEQGDEVAMYSLGIMYYRGIGVAKNTAEAIKWMKKASDKGNPHAKAVLENIGRK